MTRDEHKQIVNSLLGMTTPEKQADASLLLSQLTTDYEETLTASETATASLETMKKDFENLRDVNAKLFLQVGNTKKEIHSHEQEHNKPNNQSNNENELTFDALFNEKGDLK